MPQIVWRIRETGVIHSFRDISELMKCDASVVIVFIISFRLVDFASHSCWASFPSHFSFVLPVLNFLSLKLRALMILHYAGVVHRRILLGPAPRKFHRLYIAVAQHTQRGLDEGRDTARVSEQRSSQVDMKVLSLTLPA